MITLFAVLLGIMLTNLVYGKVQGDLVTEIIRRAFLMSSGAVIFWLTTLIGN